ncbi:MAG TPA: RidA family protein [Nannocystaceae bacterium]|nr:RidA family protein [Nannocystaceae bacterium]
MSAHRSILPPGWPRPSGFANGMAGTGELLAVAGQIAWDTRQSIVSDDFVAQFRQALANVVAVVDAAGGTASDLVSVTVYVVDKREYLAALGDVGRVWRDVVGRHFPAMALVQVAGLVEDRAKVEIQALALLQPKATGE